MKKKTFHSNKIDGNGWHEVIYDELLKIAKSEGYQPQFELDAAEDGAKYAQLRTACAHPNAVRRDDLLKIWVANIKQTFMDRFQRFLAAKPPYAQELQKFAKIANCIKAKSDEI